MSEMFFGGMPVSPDVARLNRKWPKLAEGDLIPYIDVAREIGVDAKSNRFRSVTMAWRNDLQSRGIILGCVRSAEFLVLTDKQVIAGTYGDLTSIKRKMIRRRKKLAAISIKDEADRVHRDHAARVCFNIEKAVAEQKKSITAPNVVSLPRPGVDGK